MLTLYSSFLEIQCLYSNKCSFIFHPEKLSHVLLFLLMLPEIPRLCDFDRLKNIRHMMFPVRFCRKHKTAEKEKHTDTDHGNQIFSGCRCLNDHMTRDHENRASIILAVFGLHNIFRNSTPMTTPSTASRNSKNATVSSL